MITIPTFELPHAEKRSDPTQLVAGVGSREAPLWALELMIRLGRTLADLGWGWSSGDAYGSDRAFLYGAMQSKRYHLNWNRIYLHKNFANNRDVRENLFFWDASQFDSVTLNTATSMAANARGSMYGLSPAGVMLHTRNVFQIHGHDLDSPVKLCIFYATPIGRTKVSGGTNTAFQLAKNIDVPCFNLYERETVEQLEAWLQVYESEQPYWEVEWEQILDPKSPHWSSLRELEL